MKKTVFSILFKTCVNFGHPIEGPYPAVGLVVGKCNRKLCAK